MVNCFHAFAASLFEASSYKTCVYGFTIEQIETTSGYVLWEYYYPRIEELLPSLFKRVCVDEM